MRKTKQHAQIINAMKSFGEKHFSPDELIEALKRNGADASRATVYRTIARLRECGALRTFSVGASTCYQYVCSPDECLLHYHLKCLTCGKLVHFEDSALGSAIAGVNAGGIKLDVCKTMFYGACGDCAVSEVCT